MTGAAMTMARRTFVLDAGDACLDGHFPDRPIIPGVVLLDAAMTAFGLTPPVRIEQAKFLQPCAPGMTLELTMTPVADGADVRVEHDGRLMASARLRARVDRDAEAGDV